MRFVCWVDMVDLELELTRSIPSSLVFSKNLRFEASKKNQGNFPVLVGFKEELLSETSKATFLFVCCFCKTDEHFLMFFFGGGWG